MDAERLPDYRRERLVGQIAAGDPRGAVKLTWLAEEVVRDIDDHTDPAVAEGVGRRDHRDFADSDMPLEVPRLGRTTKKWRGQIVASHGSPRHDPRGRR